MKKDPDASCDRAEGCGSGVDEDVDHSLRKRINSYEPPPAKPHTSIELRGSAGWRSEL
jgi:hypothetical protein